MTQLTEIYPQLGFAGGGAAFALYLMHLVIRFQRDFTNRYAVELHRAIEERDTERRRANLYATILARHGIEIPPDEGHGSTVAT